MSTDRGREVIRKREADTDGVPPGHLRPASPYGPDARWSAKGEDLFWFGYKIHLTESCDAAQDEAEAGGGARQDNRPNLITDVHTTASTAPDVTATAVIQQHLAKRELTPGEHYLDSGYPSADLAAAAAKAGVTMITPLLDNTSRQAREAKGFDKSAFAVDWNTRQARCPEGQTNRWWNPVQIKGRDAIVVTFDAQQCRSCPSQPQCTSAKTGVRTITLRPKELHERVAAARAAQETNSWRAKYALRAGVEGTINQALDVTGLRRARYRGLPKVSLQHAFSAAAINIVRLDAHWAAQQDPRPGRPRWRTSRLSRLVYQLAT